MSSSPESNLANAAPKSAAIPRSLSLKTKITGVMLLTVSAIAAIVHFPWAYTSRQNVNDMVSQINSEVMDSTENEVDNLFENILSSKQLITSSLDEGLIQLDEPETQGRFYLNLLKANENFTWVQFAFENGDYLGVKRRPDGLYDLIKRQWDDTLGALPEPGSALAEQQANEPKLLNNICRLNNFQKTLQQRKKQSEPMSFRLIKTGKF
jgi:hypothetical protein